MKEDLVKQVRIFQKGFNYSQDGPGNRLVYHLQGCNLHCPWCSNPESMSANGSLIKKAGHDVLSCKSIPVAEVMNEIKRSRAMFFESGGVTFTGGEPTIQMESIRDLLQSCKKEEIHTAIESNGTQERLMELIPYIDYLIMDFKHPDDEIHKQVTGMSNIIIKKNLDQLLKSGRQLAVRIPLINGFNASVETCQLFIEFLDGKVKEQVTFEFLPYHEYGKDKWEQCGMNYEMKQAYVDKETIQYFEKSFSESGYKIIHS